MLLRFLLEFEWLVTCTGYSTCFLLECLNLTLQIGQVVAAARLNLRIAANEIWRPFGQILISNLSFEGCLNVMSALSVLFCDGYIDPITNLPG